MAARMAAAFAGQLARPRGIAGRLLGRAMDLANRRPTRLAIDLLAPRAGERVIDIGCGTGAALAAVRRRADVDAAGIDPSPVMAAMAATRLGEGADIRCAELAAMPFPPTSFDAALLLNMLYFCDPDGRDLAPLHRILRPGGRAVAYVTHRDTMRDWSFTRVGLHRLYDEAALERIFMGAGFAHNRITITRVAITPSITGLLARAVR